MTSRYFLQEQIEDCLSEVELLKKQIKEALPEAKAQLCISILYDLLYGDWDLEHISFNDLCFYTDNLKEILVIQPYITGDPTHLLNLKMYFMDGETRYELTEDQIKSANKGDIYHPATNELLDSVEASEKVFMYFVASDLIKGLRKRLNANT